MSTFPAFTGAGYDISAWSEEKAFDPTIRVQSEGGYVKTRPRTTRVPMQWKVAYEFLTQANKATLQAFEDTVNVGADAFAWTEPVSGTSKTVRFKEPVRYSPMGSALYWRAEMIFEEV
jgi:hypothetical protein